MVDAKKISLVRVREWISIEVVRNFLNLLFVYIPHIICHLNKQHPKHDLPINTFTDKEAYIHVARQV